MRTYLSFGLGAVVSSVQRGPPRGGAGTAGARARRRLAEPVADATSSESDGAPSAPLEDGAAPPSLPEAGAPIDAGATVPGTITVDPANDSRRDPGELPGAQLRGSPSSPPRFLSRGQRAPRRALQASGSRSPAHRRELRRPHRVAVVRRGRPGPRRRGRDVHHGRRRRRPLRVHEAAGWKVLCGVDMKASSRACRRRRSGLRDPSSLGAALLRLRDRQQGRLLYTATSLSATWSYATFTAQWPKPSPLTILEP